MYTAPGRRGAPGIPGGEFAAGVALGAAAALLGALVGGYLARRAGVADQPMRPFTAAAVQTAPAPGPLTPASVKANLTTCADLVGRCVDATGAELVVAPESVTTGFTPGVGPAELWDLMARSPARHRAAPGGGRAWASTWWPTYEAGPTAAPSTTRPR